MEANTVQNISASLKHHITLGIAIVAILVAGIGGVASVAEVSGAVVAPGALTLRGNIKKIQHPEGGIVNDIYVQNGQMVKDGQLLIRLDDTVPRASLAVTQARLDQLRAREIRLLSELEGNKQIKFPKSLMTAAKNNEDLRDFLKSQRVLAVARVDGMTGRKKQLEEQIAQLDEQVKGLEVQIKAKETSRVLVDRQLADLKSLHQRGFAPEADVLALERESAEITGQKGQLIAQLAVARQSIAEKRTQIIQNADEFRQNVLQSLQQVRSELSEVKEQRVAGKDRLNRIDIRAPQGGIVHQLAVHTVGGVVSRAEPLMMIVPQNAEKVFEVRIAPIDVDQVKPGQTAFLRLTSLNAQSTPELTATVDRVSADLVEEEKTGEKYYTAVINVTDDELQRLGQLELVPGMPVDSFIQTGERTILSYLLKPLQDRFAHAMREE